MAALPNLITVAQFRELPEGGEYAYELHYGEVVAVTRPKSKHWKLQSRLRRLLETKLHAFGEVEIETPYRPVAEFELRVADVAAISRARWDAIDPEDNLRGAPELVIEVKSPSNTKRQLQETVSLCLANGAIECWIIDQDNRSVTVIQRDGTSRVHQSGDSIPLDRFESTSLEVAEIFQPL
jgi:Uma2 family endonuclease